MMGVFKGNTAMAKDLLKKFKNAANYKVAGIAAGGLLAVDASVRAFADKASAVANHVIQDIPGQFISHTYREMHMMYTGKAQPAPAA